MMTFLTNILTLFFYRKKIELCIYSSLVLVIY